MLKNKKDFERETSKYKMIKDRDLEHVFSKLKYIDEVNYQIIMEAGNCDLSNFCQLR